MNVVTFPLSLFGSTLRSLFTQTPRGIRCPVGVSHSRGNTNELLATTRSEAGAFLQMYLTDDFHLPDILPEGCAGALLLGHTRRRGQAVGCVQHTPALREPLHLLRLVGPGMHTFRLNDPEATGQSLAKQEAAPATREVDQERWSRTIGALSLPVWERLIGLRVGIIGVGRTGSSLALSLAQLGVRSITLIDPDEVETGNLGEMEGVTDADARRHRLKVEAVAEALRSLGLGRVEVICIAHSITRLNALHAARDCDVLFCCADHDSARMAANAIAALFCKPLIDVATGIEGTGAACRMGADVRLMLPGQCLLCFGGLQDEGAARVALSSADAEHAFYTGRRWQNERAGSLASLNRLAASLAVQLCQDLVAGEVRSSTWLHATFEAGRLAVAYPHPGVPRTACPVCALSGWGESGLPRIVEMLQSEAPERRAPEARLTELYVG